MALPGLCAYAASLAPAAQTMHHRSGDFVIASVFGAITEALARDVVAFWLEHGAMTDAAAAQRRTAELVCIARNDRGEVVGVNTAYVAGLRAPDDRYYFCRMFIRPLDRRLQLAFALARACVDTLRTHRGVGGAIRGAALVAENPKFQQPGGQRFLSQLGWRPVGKDQAGCAVWTIEFDRPT